MLRASGSEGRCVVTWTKIDDQVERNPKFARLPPGAKWLHVAALLYVLNQNNSDPMVPRSKRAGALQAIMPRSRERSRWIAALVEAGVWEAYEGYYRIVFMMDDQVKLDEIERGRKEGRTRTERSRRHRNHDHSMCLRTCPYVAQRGGSSGAPASADAL